jgi:hypothetical protein
VADTGNSTIRSIDTVTGAVLTIAGAAGSVGSLDGIGGSARFKHPCGIATDGTTIYVTDTENHTIRRIDPDTCEVTTLAGIPGMPGSTDGPSTTATFRFPHGLIYTGGRLYLSADCAIRTIYGTLLGL